MRHKTLNNGVTMPMIGLGVYDIDSRDTQRVVEQAIAAGYRSVDTAAMYHNERGVGQAVRACGLPREEIFVTTKICDACFTRERVDSSLKRLGMDHVDLMLLHWPVGDPPVMWRALEELYRQGVLRAIGVSNFYPATFERIMAGATVTPAVNQCETHVLYQQRAMVDYLRPLDVALMAWSPLAEGRHGLASHPVLAAIGHQHGKTAAQVALKFLVQNGIIIIPKTTHRERMVENISLFDFTLSDDELAAIRALDTGHNVTGWPADALSYPV